jgi:hypothetical protein
MDMHSMDNYEISFGTVPTKGFDGEKVFLSSYTITGPHKEWVESVQGSVEHEMQSDALDEAQIMGERRLVSLETFGVHRTYHHSWNNS